MKQPPVLLFEGSSYETVIRNVSLLTRGGLTLEHACDIALAKAGLKRFPMKSAVLTVPSPMPRIH